MFSEINPIDILKALEKKSQNAQSVVSRETFDKEKFLKQLITKF